MTRIPPTMEGVGQDQGASWVTKDHLCGARPSDDAGQRRSVSGADGWPEDGSPLDFDSLAEPILHAIRDAYSLTRKDRRRSIPWSGPEIAWQERANSPTFKDRLSARNLQYAEEDQGRDALAEIIGVAIQLAIEQGRRIYKTSAEHHTQALAQDMAWLALDRLASIEAMEASRAIDPERDKELLARIAYARKFAELIKP